MKLHKEMIKLNQDVATREEAIRMAGQLLVDNGCAEPEYIDAMLARNEDVSTYMGNFIAIPHGTDEGKNTLKRLASLWSRSRWGWTSATQIPMKNSWLPWSLVSRDWAMNTCSFVTDRAVLQRRIQRGQAGRRANA